MDARQPEVRRDLAEADRPGAARRVAVYLRDGQVDVPERDQAQRDEMAAGVAAPLVDHPVVVGLHAREAELLVGALHEGLAAEAREGRKRQRAVDPRERQVVDARLGLVATGPHLVVGHRADEHLRAVEAVHVAAGRRVERDRDVTLVHVGEAVLVEPVVAPRAVVGHLLLVRRADVEPELAPARALDARSLVAQPDRQTVLPEMRGLDDVVVDADDLREFAHECALGQRIVLAAGVEAAVLAHEGGGSTVDAPPVGGAPVLVAVPAETHGVGLLVDEHEVLHAGCDVAVELDDRHVADELPAGRGLEQGGEPFERVRRPERVVLGVGREHLEPPVLHELAGVAHVARAERVELHQVGNALVLGHGAPVAGGRSDRKSTRQKKRTPLSLDAGTARN